MECSKCICISCEKIDTCQYHDVCSLSSTVLENEHITKDFVDMCKDYKYSKLIDDYFNNESKK